MNKRAILLYIVFSLVTVVITYNSQTDFMTFESYITAFNKNYSQEQYAIREKIYNQNLQILEKSNCSACGINAFSDWSQQQMNGLKGGNAVTVPQYQGPVPVGFVIRNITSDIPTSFDWRDLNAVTPIKNQRTCGGCWAYTTTAFFESELIITQNYTNSLDLSEQFILTCDNRSLGCDGGFLQTAMQKVIDLGGMPQQKQYPMLYTSSGNKGMCETANIQKVDQTSKVFSYYNIYDQSFIQKMLLKRPLSINVCSSDFKLYSPTSSSRTLSCNPSNGITDHTVLLVGYTQTEWIVKNQWNTSWGVQGYGYISRKAENDCCIGSGLTSIGTVTPSSSCQIFNCQICVQKSSCNKCISGHYIINLGSQQICQTCFQKNCKECMNNYGTCNYCEDGYSVSYPKYSCFPSTVSNCAFLYNNQCQQCKPGYFLTNDMQCLDNSVKSTYVEKSTSEGMDIGLIAGIAAGAGTGLILIIISIICLCKHRQSKQISSESGLGSANDKITDLIDNKQTKQTENQESNPTENYNQKVEENDERRPLSSSYVPVI